MTQTCEPQGAWYDIVLVAVLCHISALNFVGRMQFWLGFCGVPLIWLLHWLNFHKQPPVRQFPQSFCVPFRKSRTEISAIQIRYHFIRKKIRHGWHITTKNVVSMSTPTFLHPFNHEQLLPAGRTPSTDAMADSPRSPPVTPSCGAPPGCPLYVSHCQLRRSSPGSPTSRSPFPPTAARGCGTHRRPCPALPPIAYRPSLLRTMRAFYRSPYAADRGHGRGHGRGIGPCATTVHRLQHGPETQGRGGAGAGGGGCARAAAATTAAPY
jgi:hypothetical protein